MHTGYSMGYGGKFKPTKYPTSPPSFKENTSPVTYSDEVEETIGLPIKVEPFYETPLEDLALNTCNHDIPLSSRRRKRPEIPIQTTLVLDSFRIKEVDHLTIHTPPSPHVGSFHPKDTYCYYHPCIDDLKKHYGFKPGLFRKSGSLGVDFLNMDMIEDDWELEPKEVSFLGRRLNLPGFAVVLAILVTGASQSRQHGKSESESCKSPTAELFEVDSGRISIRHCEY
ncbi:hypothetical protein Tco_0771352 [Tanacetum coccineum]|uniref:Transmembrane protein n=1 Tax=Tanacetum coccineum TaxID=301880 RepID=A0ABQ4ZG46_9ASTR